MCVLFVYTLLKVVSYYDLSVLSMSVMGLQKSLDAGWVCGMSSIQVYFGFFYFAKPRRGPHRPILPGQKVTHLT